MTDVIDQARRQLRAKIEEEGEVLDEEFLKVDSFLNHKVSPVLMNLIGEALAKFFEDKGVTKVVTAEAAGNIIAYTTADKLTSSTDREVEVIYAKKGVPQTMANEEVRTLQSPTKGNSTNLAISGDFLDPADRILVVDDFLFTGRTVDTISEIIEDLSGEIVGYGFVICKKQAGGYPRLQSRGKPIFSLIEIESMDPQTSTIEFGST